MKYFCRGLHELKTVLYYLSNIVIRLMSLRYSN